MRIARSVTGIVALASSIGLAALYGPVDSAQAAPALPAVNSVAFSGAPGDYTLDIKGSGFGVLRDRVPFTGALPYFAIMDNAQVGHGVWGNTVNHPHPLRYEAWTNSEIIVGGFGGAPGDALQIMIWSPQSRGDVAWAGNVPGGSMTPAITSVTMSGFGRNLTLAITGTGFGAAPGVMPFDGDLNFLRFHDWGQEACEGGIGLMEAGFGGWRVYAPNQVTLRYASWSDTKIVISGFAGAYGSGCDRVLPGDPITVGIWASTDKTDAGPQTAWAGRS